MGLVCQFCFLGRPLLLGTVLHCHIVNRLDQEDTSLGEKRSPPWSRHIPAVMGPQLTCSGPAEGLKKVEMDLWPTRGAAFLLPDDLLAI